jgi:hypothetical protein
MSYLKIDQKDFKVILSVASILPVICFIGGFYTGQSSQSQQFTQEIPSDPPIAEQVVSVPDRAELDAPYEQQGEIGSADSFNQNTGLPGEYDEAWSGDIEHKDGVKDADSSLANIMEVREQLPENHQKDVTADFNNEEKAKPESMWPNVTSQQNFNEYLVQAGRFSSYDNAAKFQIQLAGKNLSSEIALDGSTAQPEFLIIVTSFANKDEAKQYCHFAERFYHLDFFVKTRMLDMQNSSESFASL